MLKYFPYKIASTLLKTKLFYQHEFFLNYL